MALGDSIEQHLRTLPLFSGIPDDKAYLLAALVHYLPLQPNEILFEEGDLDADGNSLYIILEGTGSCFEI